jgi:hypothetical protein
MTFIQSLCTDICVEIVSHWLTCLEISLLDIAFSSTINRYFFCELISHNFTKVNNPHYLTLNMLNNNNSLFSWLTSRQLKLVSIKIIKSKHCEFSHEIIELYNLSSPFRYVTTLEFIDIVSLKQSTRVRNCILKQVSQTINSCETLKSLTLAKIWNSGYVIANTNFKQLRSLHSFYCDGITTFAKNTINKLTKCNHLIKLTICNVNDEIISIDPSLVNNIVRVNPALKYINLYLRNLHNDVLSEINCSCPYIKTVILACDIPTSESTVSITDLTKGTLLYLKIIYFGIDIPKLKQIPIFTFQRNIIHQNNFNTIKFIDFDDKHPFMKQLTLSLMLTTSIQFINCKFTKNTGLLSNLFKNNCLDIRKCKTKPGSLKNYICNPN